MSANKKYPSGNEILQAYKLLFALSYSPPAEKVKNLDLAVLKSAYKKMAMVNHPDRSRVLGIQKNILEGRFKNINQAYDELCSFIENGKELSGAKKVYTAGNYRAGSHTRKAYNARHNSKRSNTDRKAKSRKKRTWPGYKRWTGRAGEQRQKKNYQDGRKRTDEAKQSFSQREKSSFNSTPFLPKDELLIGQYLFYSNMISLNSLIEAVHWQRNQRPSFGKIALEWNIITQDDIISILRNMRPREKFGHCAFRMGLINSFQYRAILARQQNAQKPIGEYFVKRGLISREELGVMLNQVKIHNSYIKMRKNS